MLAALFAAALLVAAFGGCGGGDATTASSGSTTRGSAANDGGDGVPDGKGEPSQESSRFGTPGADDSIQRTGQEASVAEREAASTVVLAYLRAGAAEDRAAQCSYLAAEAARPLERIGAAGTEGSGTGCPQGLDQLLKLAPKAAHGAAPAGAVGSLRVEGDRGFALFHGKDGLDYMMPLVKEGGEWKIASVVALELP